MKNFAEQIRNTIEKEKIIPIPRWVFWIKNIFFITLFITSVLLGALAISIIFYYIFEGGFEALHPRLIHIVSSIPIFWVLSFIIFSVFSFWGMQHVPKGYKITFGAFIGINIVSSFIFGSFFYLGNIPEKIENFSQNIPFHRPLDDRIQGFWLNSQEGRLAGRVIDVEKKYFLLETRNNQVWKVLFPEKKIENREARKMEIMKHNFLNQKIKVEGNIVLKEEHIFQAEKVLPWRRSRFQR